MYGLSEQELDIARPLVFARIDRTASTIVLHEPEIQKDRKQRMLDRDVYVFVYAYVYVYVDVYVYVYVFVLLSVGKFFFQKSSTYFAQNLVNFPCKVNFHLDVLSVF